MFISLRAAVRTTTLDVAVVVCADVDVDVDVVDVDVVVVVAVAVAVAVVAVAVVEKNFRRLLWPLSHSSRVESRESRDARTRGAGSVDQLTTGQPPRHFAPRASINIDICGRRRHVVVSCTELRACCVRLTHASQTSL